MDYEINVSRHGVHLFATHERSVRDSTKAKSLTKEIRYRFPESEGFQVTCKRINCTIEATDF